MLVRLDLSSDDAIYDQIAAQIADQVDAGLLQPGQRLPAARRLAESLDINVHTVLKGYAALERQGLIDIRRGRGGVVVQKSNGVAAMIRQLVERAKAEGIAGAELVKMIEESW